MGNGPKHSNDEAKAPVSAALDDWQGSIYPGGAEIDVQMSAEPIHSCEMVRAVRVRWTSSVRPALGERIHLLASIVVFVMSDDRSVLGEVEDPDEPTIRHCLLDGFGVAGVVVEPEGNVGR